MVLLRPCVALGALSLPVFSLVVLAWPGDGLSRLSVLASFESLDLGSERVMRLDQLDAELVQTELLQCLGTLHRAIYVVETVSGVISARA